MPPCRPILYRNSAFGATSTDIRAADVAPKDTRHPRHPPTFCDIRGQILRFLSADIGGCRDIRRHPPKILRDIPVIRRAYERPPRRMSRMSTDVGGCRAYERHPPTSVRRMSRMSADVDGWRDVR
jgi:hypothetical protein